MAIASLVVSVVALMLAGVASELQRRASRRANNLPVLIELFREHRDPRLARARELVYRELRQADLSAGLNSIADPDERQQVLDLCWFYDNLGALVAHGVIDLDPVSGYLGGSVMEIWDIVQPMVLAERSRRSSFRDPSRWQEYFENLYHLVTKRSPATARAASPSWAL
jgi:hypothetical protein